MSAQTMSVIAGALLSLGVAYIPGVKQKWSALSSDWERLIMLLLLAVVAGATYALSCAGWTTRLTCDEAGLQSVVESFFAALVANQSTYVIGVQGRDAKETGALRADKADG